LIDNVLKKGILEQTKKIMEAKWTSFIKF
jgi:hypothetical protein